MHCQRYALKQMFNYYYNAVIISMDVKALCSSIPHTDGIEACENIMVENGFPFLKITNVTKFIDFILAHNYC